METHASEVRNMLFTEFNLETALEVRYEEGHEEGREKGRKEGREEGREKGREEGREKGREEGRTEGEILKARDVAKKMLKNNKPINEIIEYSGLSIEEINKLRNT